MEGNLIFRLKNILSKPQLFIIVAILLFLPLLFIGVSNSHDWGDDFAQYIHQAENIVHGIPQSETGYLFNPSNYIGPQAYPIGFPLLLVPVYVIAGNSILAFTALISLFYFLLCLLIVYFYRQYFSAITTLLLAFILMYNPLLVNFKREIMSDIPFTALLVLNFILYQKNKSRNIKQTLLLSILTGFMITIRPAGFVFIAAVAMDQLINLIRRKVTFLDFIIHTGLIVFIPASIYFTLNSLIFKVPSGGSIQDYLVFFNSNTFLQIIPENLTHHIEVLRYLYAPEAGNVMGPSLILGTILSAMIIVGFVKRLILKPDAIDWFFIFYAGMLLLFPNNHSAFRLMIPISFIMIMYAGTGLKSIQLSPKVTTFKKVIAAGIFVSLLYIPGIHRAYNSTRFTIEGPQMGTSIEAFNYISKNVSPKDIIVFTKPRALALYTGCCGMADPFTTNPTLINQQIMDAKASYLLINNNITSEPMKRYAQIMQNRTTKQWENKDFVLLKINPINPSIHH